MLLKGCLNGGRGRHDHPRCPITPKELADAGEAAVAAGAAALHVHPRGKDGAETLEPGFVASTLDAMRERVAVPIGVTTGAWIAPDVGERLRAVERWSEQPDFASVNFHETGAGELAALLLDRGVGIEAGVWTAESATVLCESGLVGDCLRILLEPLEQSVEGALSNVRAMEARLDAAGAERPRLLHGVAATAWPLLEYAGGHGYDVRMGLEDTLVNRDGTTAADNAELIGCAIRLLRG